MYGVKFVEENIFIGCGRGYCGRWDGFPICVVLDDFWFGTGFGATNCLAGREESVCFRLVCEYDSYVCPVGR